MVNFAPELSEAIAETKYLEKLGFGVSQNNYMTCIIIIIVILLNFVSGICRFLIWLAVLLYKKKSLLHSKMVLITYCTATIMCWGPCQSLRYVW